MPEPRGDERSKWGSMLMSRSRSLSPRRTPRRSPSQSPPLRHRMIPPPEPVTSKMGSLVKSWIMTPTVTATEHTTNTKTFLPKTPILTLMLIRLEETIPLYCQKLAVPTLENAAAAAALLEQAVATASSSPSSTPNSNVASPSSPIAGSALALQSCWETYISPLLLLAAAEALYCKERSPKLIALYVKIAGDLTVVRQTLCDPILDNRDGFPHSDTAKSLAKALNRLGEWTSMRCQVIEMVVQASSSIQQVRPLFQTLLQEISRRSSPTDDMMSALKTELQLWVWLLDACWNVQQCRFMDTILTTRRIRVMLESLVTKTKLHEWFTIALHQIQSLLPLYFDRLRAHAIPLYGFNPSRLGTSSVQTDYDAQIMNFLRRHEGAMAISIVLEDQNDDSWPAMYLRSSIDGLTRSSSSGGSLSSRLLLGRRDEEVDEISHLEQYNNTRGWPHTEWKELVTILRNEVNPEELGPAMTFRAKEVESASSPNAAPGFLARAPAAPTSYFHVVALSSTTCVWLVAIVKDDAAAESNKWNLRMSRAGHHHSEDTVRAFMDEMAAKLRVSNLIINTTCKERDRDASTIGTTSAPSLAPTKLKRVLSTDDLVLEWTEPSTQQWLRTIKEQFGLRPQSPLVKPLKSPYRLNFRGLQGQDKRPRGRKRRGRSKTVEESAAAWFLGPELLELAKEGKLELSTRSVEWNEES